MDKKMCETIKTHPHAAFSLPKEAGTWNLYKNIQNLNGGNFFGKDKSSWFIFDESFSLLAWARPSLKLDRRSPCHSLGNWLQDILRILKDMSEILSWHRLLSSSVSEAAQNYF